MKNKCYILEEKFPFFLKPKYVITEILQYLVHFCCTKRLKILHEVFRVFPLQLFCMQVKLISPLENKEQLIRFRVCGKSATSAQTEGD